MATHMKNEEIWMRGSYYVRSLHPTLKFLMWDYGYLDEAQERDYINAKLKMLQKQISDVEVSMKYCCNYFVMLYLLISRTVC